MQKEAHPEGATVVACPPASFEATAVCAAPLNTRDRREGRSSTQTTQTNVLVAHIGVLGHCTTWLGESVALPAINDGLGPLRLRGCSETAVLWTEEISFAEHPKSHTALDY
ncbi:MAG: hypothetical protein ACPIOQ_62625 [Promethearchaeia archaeon]